MGTSASQQAKPLLTSNEKSQWQGGGLQEDASTVCSPTSSSTSSSPSSWSRGGDGTLIIFDWDDTLLCSSALDYTPKNAEILRTLERTVDQVLRTAMSLGETIIVTNGCGTWVQESSKTYLPGVVPTLEMLTVTSARALYEHLNPADPSAWKRRAFSKIARRKRSDGHEGLNLVVLGDQSAEMQAAHCAAKVLQGPSLIKTVKFVESPSVEQLIGQLLKVAEELDNLVSAVVSSSSDLSKRRLTSENKGKQDASCAAFWTFSSGRDWGKLPSVLSWEPDEGDREESSVNEVDVIQEFGAFDEIMRITDTGHEEVEVDDDFMVGGQARRGTKTPLCALCTWYPGTEMRTPLPESQRVLSI